MGRSQQMTWLANAGFEVAWSQSVTDLTADQLKEAFKTRRAESKYECDGIVVGTDTIPLAPTASNPKDSFAFKMPVADQMATTIVREVDWASSRTGNWIPRLRFDPVKIGTATIEYCTGFHAQFIRNNRLGPGARVVIRRSGDVIPTLDSVLEPAATWFEPPAGRWKWDETETHAVDTTTEATPEKLALEMAHSLVSLGVEGYSKTSTKKLVDGGIRELKDLKKATKSRLQQLLGNVNGEKLYDAFQGLAATEQQGVRAFCGWPKGFGESRITATFAVETDVRKWPTLIMAPAGQSMTAFVEVQKAVPAYLTWRESIGTKAVVPPTPIAPAVVAPHKGNYVMSGFRDAEIQKRLTDAGWKEQDSIKKDTNLLLVPDAAKETTKVKAAKAAGIRILPRSQVNTLF
jgi:NAD-dependent DNA ligase